MPNFYFHATTAYDILRHKGVAVGKRDFIGQLRLKRSARAWRSTGVSACCAPIT